VPDVIGATNGLALPVEAQQAFFRLAPVGP